MEEKTYHIRVFEVTCLIPVGRVTSYGAIADYLCLGSARMVGWALNHCNNYKENVPAHRVVNSKGELSARNRFATPTMMQEMLEQEGLTIVNNKVMDFKSRHWHPEELED